MCGIFLFKHPDIDDEEAQRSNTVPIPNYPEPLLALPATNDEVVESIELNRLPTACLPPPLPHKVRLSPLTLLY
jgi:hypothetical protein